MFLMNLFTKKSTKPNGLKKFLLKLFIKRAVVSEKLYPKNGQTASYFIVKDSKKFEAEKKRLIDYIEKTQELGKSYFVGKESHLFGALSEREWNNMLSKHLNHHLTQFGV